MKTKHATPVEKLNTEVNNSQQTFGLLFELFERKLLPELTCKILVKNILSLESLLDEGQTLDNELNIRDSDGNRVGLTLTEKLKNLHT